MRIPPVIAKKEPLWRRIVIALGIGLLLGWAARDIIRAHDGDFKVHWETGRRFLAGEFLYASGHDFPYPPFLGMTFAPAALLPMPIAKAVLYPVGVAALLVLLWIQGRFVRSAFHLDETQTPAIFLGYFIWKGQWRIAICTAAGALFFTAAPIVGQGPALWRDHMRSWAGNAVHGISGTGSDFEASEMLRTKNMSLRPSLMGYLGGLPENSRRSWDPPSIEFLNLSPAVAGWVVNAILLTILAIFIWWSRGVVVARDEPRLLWEFAAAGVLMLLFSPITWGQHCVALLPACYLIAGLLVVRDSLPRWIIMLLSVYIFFCSLLGRDLIGRDLSLRLATYHISTFCMVGLFAIVLAGPRLLRSR